MTTFPKLRRPLLAAALPALLAGCALGPDFEQPKAPAVDRYSFDALPAATAQPGKVLGGNAQTFQPGGVVPERWWTGFGSPRLDALVDAALAGNPSLQSAQAALRRAQQELVASRSSLFPSVDANFDATRQKVNLGAFGNPNGGSFIYNLFTATVGVTYGLDIWGGTRRGVEASRAAAEYSAFETEAAYQTLVAKIVTTAITIAENNTLARGQILVLDDERKRTEITEKQYVIGAVGKPEAIAARKSYADEQAKLPPFQLAVTQGRHLLATFAGKAPSEELDSGFDLFDLKLPADVPVALPSELVRRRPDVRAAEAQWHQAAANVGVATSNLFPQIALTAKLGTQASQFEGLFDGNIFSLGANITQPLFHFGELTAKRRAAVAAYEGAGADYRGTVLNAFREVADALRALEADAQVMQAQVVAAEAAEAQLQIARTQFEAGAGTRSALLEANANLTRVRAGYLIALADRLRDTATLYHALGGHWQTLAAEGETAPAAGTAGAP